MKFNFGRLDRVNTVETMTIQDLKPTKTVKDIANNVLSVVTFEIVGAVEDGSVMSIPVFMTSPVSIKNTLLGILDQNDISSEYDDAEDRKKCKFKANLDDDSNIFFFNYLKSNLIGKSFRYKATAGTSNFLNYNTMPWALAEENV